MTTDVNTDIRARTLDILENFLVQRGHPFDRSKANELRALGIDSLGMTELVFELSEAFGIDDRRIDNNTLLGLRTIDDLVAAIAAAQRAS